MIWYVVLALVTCSLNAMLAAIILSLSAYHLVSDKSTNAPIEPNEEWIRLVNYLVPFTICWLILSISGMYVSMSKKKSWGTTAVLSVYVICLGVSIYFAAAFGNQLDMDDVNAGVLFNETQKEINKHANSTWIPEWLDNIQKQSKHCCGIKTFRDYEEFWPSDSFKIPRSCCKGSSPTPTSCPPDIRFIPYPNTPDDFFKVEMGCMEEILTSARAHIEESYHNAIAMTMFIVFAILAYLLVYAKRIGFKKPKQEEVVTEEASGKGDAGDEGHNKNADDTRNSPLMITSSGLIMSALESLEGLQSLRPLESSPPWPIESGKPLTDSGIALVSTNRIGIGVGRTNAVLAGLHHQQQQLAQLQQLQQQQQLQQLQLYQQQLQLQIQGQQALQQPQPIQQQQLPSLIQQQPLPIQQQSSARDTTLGITSTAPRAELIGIESSTGNKQLGSDAAQLNQPPTENVNHRVAPPVAIPETGADSGPGSSDEAQQTEQTPNSPPGSPGRRLKKVRREALQRLANRKDLPK